MMLVVMRTILAGPVLNAGPGQVIEVDESMALDLIKGGYALPLKKDVVEVATLEPVENAAMPKPRQRKKS
jgi:hypothetical protein